ncbi:hypothetical protein L3073_07540 [Ancylomarina sp. DW003]|nr:hypothetical protein [Ancylomarina sp. DW003]MDE5422059.1 hypothetical protein [Ancylomarina sp. DW003]
MKFKYEGKRLTIDNEILEFDVKIQKVVPFENFVIVLTDHCKTETNENVYCVDKYCKFKWTIERAIGIDDPYSNIVKKDENTIELINWNGTDLTVDTWTGKFKTTVKESNQGKRPW